jgi:MEDS: MEthanogen/methylotroph, DcmR Sensory domain/Histidine kinase-like ATPase domain
MAVGLEEIGVEAGEHVVQFYEDDGQLARTIGGYLTSALADGAVAIVIATEAHRRLFAAELEAAGMDSATSAREEKLIMLDAAATMARFVDAGRVDRDGFRRIVGSVVERAADSRRPVRAYGEMVALLWEAGDVLAAIELEKAWNDLARELPFALVCAYRSESVHGSEHAEALHEVCHLHTSVVGTPAAGERESSTAAEVSAHFSPEFQAPASARHFVADVLSEWGYASGLLEDAKLVVSELATNAVMHARSPFSVVVSPSGNVVRLSVRDASRARPSLRADAGLAPSGRGLRLVDALSACWGVEFAGEGKTVWAELRP